MSLSLAHNRPVEVLHLYFNRSGGIMTLCELATTEKTEVAAFLVHDRRVVLRALANERFWPALPVVWDRLVRQFMRVVEGPSGLSETQARDWQDETLQLYDEIADALADTAHVAAQGQRAMTHLFESLTSPPHQFLERAQRHLFQPASPTESDHIREDSKSHGMLWKVMEGYGRFSTSERSRCRCPDCQMEG
ncbi:BZ3500_MvSof-1268-A1-R1_Chr6-2g08432 [Microbotryum saponariae]|uniref:BZ3500_MvSof-1268-A1-R1_Chr6-2g08432 protein n=1 Tax=Microbotryum saponariae TaxID=289078 RepID=A0A2X0LP04_9BASI|nr:BZ3500_MvSof-1268-A1-R1_Chr6-2g08432 [Microbotryum saponariae]SDA07709.1 BZ3501_MvSof-1269-A2-R1_Chr6-1g08146 [Microbotryum saponariae]